MWWKKSWRRDDSVTLDNKDHSYWSTNLKMSMPFSKLTHNEKMVKCKRKLLTYGSLRTFEYN